MFSKKINIVKNVSGFSLPTVMITIGLLATASVGVMKLINSQEGIINLSESKGSEVNIISKMETILASKKNCIKTFEGIGPGQSINSLKLSNDIDVFTQGSLYENRKIKIEQMQLSNNSSLAADSSGILDLTISLERTKIKKEDKVIRKTIPINLTLDENREVISCYSDATGVLESQLEESCNEMGGNYSNITKLCSLTSNCLIESTSNILSTKCLDDLMNLNVSLSGATMTGELVAPLVSSTELCIGSDCRSTFSTQSCSDGGLINTLNVDGSVTCSKSLGCPDGSFLNGISKSTGDPICNTLPNVKCPIEHYVSEVRPDGGVTCSKIVNTSDVKCKEGDFVSGIVNGVLQCSTLEIEETCEEPKYYKSALDNASNVTQCLVDTESKDSAGKCQRTTGEIDATAGLCKKLDISCSGNKSGVISNYPDGTICGTNKTCKSGDCELNQCFETLASIAGTCSDSFCGGVPECPSSSHSVIVGLVKCDTGTPTYNGSPLSKCKFQFGPGNKSIGSLSCNVVSCS